MQPSARQAAEAEFRRHYQNLFTRPDLLPYQLDIPRRRILLALLDEPMYRRALFLDQRLNAGALQAFWTPAARVLETDRSIAGSAAPAIYIFHIGHCGSTLISRLLGDRPDLLPLREPLVLRTLAESRRGLRRPESFISEDGWAQLLTLMLRLLSRSYRQDQTALIKATSHCNNLLSPILKADPDNLGLGIYIDLETYLANLLRPRAQTALYAFAEQRIQDLEPLLGEATPHLHALNPARLGAINWCASMLHYVVAQQDADIAPRLTLVNFDRFLKQPNQNLTDMLTFLGLDHSTQGSENRLSAAYLQTYAKDPRIPYTPESRTRELAASRTANAAEIADALEWARELTGRSEALSGIGNFLRLSPSV